MKFKDVIFMLIFFVITMLLYSCGGDTKKTATDNQLGKLEVKIPASLKDKPEVVSYIHDMNAVADDYAMLIDQVFVDFKGFENRDMNKLGMMDKIKLMKVSAEVGFKSLDMVSRWGDYHNKLDLFKEDLNEDETLALESVMKRFEERMKQIDAKHSEFFKKNNIIQESK